jgi:hypothetical protein
VAPNIEGDTSCGTIIAGGGAALGGDMTDQ